ncbi:Os05g0242200 [Oryza sativa Japonica Group]|uniref:Os05g0242200 protein n=1 Tax=Oryza sativa subsp. japonica TaxID=39947 RepID=A0A0P0WJM7_ORYSJ|nr:Os05g0242200 [Oryza sativa Japonica Group]
MAKSGGVRNRDEQQTCLYWCCLLMLLLLQGNWQLPNSTVYALAKLAPLVASLFLSFSSCTINQSIDGSAHRSSEIMN